YPSSSPGQHHGAAAGRQVPYLVYGDSLTWESADDIRARMGSQVVVRSYPGTAPCQWLGWLPADLAAYHPKVVGIVTAGNPCPGQTMGTLPYFLQYENDVAAMFSTITASGARVVFFDAPPMLDPVRETFVAQFPVFAQALAAEFPGVTVSDAIAAALSSDGAYTSTLPCLPTERVGRGCVGGRITVRTTVGLQAGLHLCPTGLPAAYPWKCPTYSSGEYRFAKAVASGLRAAWTG
ncbi:MAG TPA: hypothetical protein VMB72_05885, partial [Acidimicrobiales bacterium]|nr:hypothetical protein [Acidimicrobiales bacterium]